MYIEKEEGWVVLLNIMLNIIPIQNDFVISFFDSSKSDLKDYNNDESSSKSTIDPHY